MKVFHFRDVCSGFIKLADIFLDQSHCLLFWIQRRTRLPKALMTSSSASLNAFPACTFSFTRKTCDPIIILSPPLSAWKVGSVASLARPRALAIEPGSITCPTNFYPRQLVSAFSVLV